LGSLGFALRSKIKNREKELEKGKGEVEELS